MLTQIPVIVLFVLIAYAVGSIQFGLLLSRFLGLDDPRKSGSGNSGATNVARTHGARLGIYVLVGDCLKGVLVVVASRFLGLSDWLTATAALGVVLGHAYPLYHQFKGGKGVATALGVILVLSPLAAVIALAGFVGIVAYTRYVSLGSVVSAALAWVAMAFIHWGLYLVPMAVLVALVIYRHHSNIQRLLSGEENKLSLKK